MIGNLPLRVRQPSSTIGLHPFWARDCVFAHACLYQMPDVAGEAPMGTISGATSIGAHGMQGFSFGTSNENTKYVEFASASGRVSDMAVTGDFTAAIAAIANSSTPSGASYDRLASRNASTIGAGNWGFYITAPAHAQPQKVYFTYRSSDNLTDFYVGPVAAETALSQTQPETYVATMTGTTAKLWQNGTLVDTQTFSKLGGANSNVLRFGADLNNANSGPAATLFGLSWWNRGFTDGEALLLSGNFWRQYARARMEPTGLALGNLPYQPWYNLAPMLAS